MNAITIRGAAQLPAAGVVSLGPAVLRADQPIAPDRHILPWLLDPHGLTQLELIYDSKQKALWQYLNPTDRPSSTQALLEDMLRVFDRLDRHLGHPASADVPLRYLVTASSLPGIFNLGGDLPRIASLIRTQDRAGLQAYAHLCIDVQFARAMKRGHGYISITLVQGDALGGGFEAVLANDIIVAEKGAKFGMPEILFNMFPGMGALTFLTRRIGQRLAEEIVFSGNIYPAEELHAMGLVDILAEVGEGEEAVSQFIARRDRQYHARAAVYGARNTIQPVSYRELIDITEMWVDIALKADDRDLRKMERLAAAQDKRSDAAA